MNSSIYAHSKGNKKNITPKDAKSVPPHNRSTKPSYFLYVLIFLIGLCEYLFVKFAGLRLSNNAAGILLAVNLFLLLMLAIFRPEKITIVIIAFLLPFHLLFPEFKIGTITFNAFTAAIILMGIYALSRNSIIGWKRYSVSLFDLAILIYLFISLWGMLFISKDIKDSGYMSFHGIFIPVLSYFVIKSFFRGEEDAGELSLLLIFSMAVFAMATLQEYATTHERTLTPIGAHISGATLLFWGGTLALYSGAINSLAARLLLSLFIIAAMASTFSRAYLFLFLALMPISLMLKWRLGKWVVIGFLIVGTMLTVASMDFGGGLSVDNRTLATIETSSNRLTDVRSYEGALSGRGVMWNIGFQKFMQSPLIGWGAHTAEGMLYNSYHNNYIDWLAYGGLIGFFLQMFFFIQHFQKADKQRKINKMLLANLLVVLAVLANGFANGIAHGVMPSLIFILFALNEVMLGRNQLQKNSAVQAS
jgi:O-antigen ligase